MPEQKHRAGYVGLIGRPNVGKSTLLNRVLEQKVAATASKPQTTRNRVAGIYNAPGLQAVLVDTPGIHRPRCKLNESMVRAAVSALADSDVVVWLLDGPQLLPQAQQDRPILVRGDAYVADQVQAAGAPVVVAINKVDVLERRWLLPIMAACHERFPAAAVVPISALKGDGLPELLAEIGQRLPLHPPFFPSDQLLEQSERFVVAEIVREKIVRFTNREIPYTTAVEVERFDERARGGERPFVHIHARIIVERDSQKGILIGRRGSMLKRIGSQARQDIQRLLGAGVRLDLFVAVESDWTRNPRLLRELGYE